MRSLVIGWASADWSSLHRHIDAGRMPNLQRLIEHGTIASLASAAPLLPEALYTSIATGALADRHGVLTPLQIRADGGGVERVGRRSWRMPAFWEVLEANGIHTACVNWPATATADRWPGIHVDNTFAIPTGTTFDTWAVPPRSVAPPGLAAALAELRVHPADDLAEYLAALVPRAREVDQTKDRRLTVLGEILARLMTVHAAATHIASMPNWDVLCAWYEFPHDISVAFHAERPDGIFGGVVAQAHALLDMNLGRLMGLAGDATVFVLSTDGVSFGVDGEIRRHESGIFIARGPGIAADAVLPAMHAVDFAPTLLARHGLSSPCADQDRESQPGPPVDGQVIAALVPATTTLQSPRPGAVMPEPEPEDPAEALLADGYRDTLTTEQSQAIDGAQCLYLFHLGDALITRGDYPSAARSLETLLARRPDHAGALRQLARCRLLMADPAGCRPLADALLGLDPDDPWGHLIMATSCALTAGADSAESHIASARRLGAGNPTILSHLGGLEVVLGRPEAAVADFDAALALHPAMAEAHYGSGLAHQRLGHLAEAELALRRAIGLEHNMPLAHLQLGALLSVQNRQAEAVRELETAVAQQPAHKEAGQLLRRAREALAREFGSAAGRT